MTDVSRQCEAMETSLAVLTVTLWDQDVLNSLLIELFAYFARSEINGDVFLVSFLFLSFSVSNITK